MTPDNDPGHGHSPAAWIAVSVSTAGLFAAAAFFFLAVWTPFWISMAVFLGGLLLGPLLAALGYGVRGPKWQPKDTH
ncbi:MAG: HGxxPAAW family protein [Pontimonas sp.]